MGAPCAVPRKGPGACLVTRRLVTRATYGICIAKTTASYAQAPESEVWDIERVRRPDERTNPQVDCVHIGRERAEMLQERFSRGVPGGGPGLGPCLGTPQQGVGQGGWEGVG